MRYELYHKGRIIVEKSSIRECIQYALDNGIPTNEIKEVATNSISRGINRSTVPLPIIHNFERFMKRKETAK